MRDDTPERSYDDREVGMILRTAADLQARGSGLVPEPGLTVSEIQRVGTQVGIPASSVSAASLAVSLAKAHARSPHFRHVHQVPGEIAPAAWESVADAIRTAAGPVEIRRLESGLEFELPLRAGQRESLVVSVVSREGATTLTTWSERPGLKLPDRLGHGVVGTLPVMFAAVASGGGHLPGMAAIFSLLAGGAGLGVAIGGALDRWQAHRWRNRLAEVLAPIAARIAELASP
jgi:hypothetical protein